MCQGFRDNRPSVSGTPGVITQRRQRSSVRYEITGYNTDVDSRGSITSGGGQSSVREAGNGCRAGSEGCNSGRYQNRSRGSIGWGESQFRQVGSNRLVTDDKPISYLTRHNPGAENPTASTPADVYSVDHAPPVVNLFSQNPEKNRPSPIAIQQYPAALL